MHKILLFFELFFFLFILADISLSSNSAGAQRQDASKAYKLFLYLIENCNFDKSSNRQKPIYEKKCIQKSGMLLHSVVLFPYTGKRIPKRCNITRVDHTYSSAHTRQLHRLKKQLKQASQNTENKYKLYYWGHAYRWCKLRLPMFI